MNSAPLSSQLWLGIELGGGVEFQMKGFWTALAYWAAAPARPFFILLF